MYHRSRFSSAAKKIANATGHPVAFVIAAGTVTAWAMSGPIFGFSDTWQLVINTSTTIVTFLMVFLIQNSQNRDTAAIQIKLDEVIRALEGAHNALLDLEELDPTELERIRGGYKRLAAESRKSLREGRGDTGRVEVQDNNIGTDTRSG